MNVKMIPEAHRYTKFLEAWEAHTKAGFAATQEEVDRIAALWFVKAPKLQPPAEQKGARTTEP